MRKKVVVHDLMQQGYTYYLPLTESMKNKTIEVFVLDMKGSWLKKLKPEVWLTSHFPYESQEMILS